ncbi:MAG: HNH endonuclease family protein [Actinomycetota bacterium]|nr:HNH endonuclease family protein [Actinomycetota bacterium]
MRGPALTSRGLAAALVAVLAIAIAPPATAAPDGVDAVEQMLEALAVQPERNRGYSRDRFDDWHSYDGCDTREIVLIREARGGTRRGCVMARATWWSYLDGDTTRNPSRFDIDHTVALAEAWGSGAKGWTRARRDAFANDLGYRDSLIAVSASSNRSKGERDPAEWMPPRAAADCRLVQAWIAVKWRWGLSIDASEKRALERELADCDRLVVPIPAKA